MFCIDGQMGMVKDEIERGRLHVIDMDGEPNFFDGAEVVAFFPSGGGWAAVIRPFSADEFFF